MSNTQNDFDAAKTISDLLKDMEKDRQQRILRWVAESLEIGVHIKAGVQHLSTSGDTVTTPSPPSGRAADIKSFVASKNPKSDIQFTTVVAYYYRFEAAPDNRKESISSEVLQDAARLAGRARLVKPLNTLNNARKQGYLDAAERGFFKINSVGENLVAMTLPGTENNSKIKPKRLKKTTKATIKK